MRPGAATHVLCMFIGDRPGLALLLATGRPKEMLKSSTWEAPHNGKKGLCPACSESRIRGFQALPALAWTMKTQTLRMGWGGLGSSESFQPL